MNSNCVKEIGMGTIKVDQNFIQVIHGEIYFSVLQSPNILPVDIQ